MVRAKFSVTSIIKNEDLVSPSEVVYLNAVYSSDPTSENYSWSKWTPAGSLSMTITNPDCFGKFEQGKTYYLDFTPVE